MKHILIIGAGLSSSYLIRYLLEHSEKYSWKITVADTDPDLANRKVNDHSNGLAISLNVQHAGELNAAVSQADLVISMLPAIMHIQVAHVCLQHRKHLFTASYISEEMKSLHIEALKSNVLFLNECGLDPGIDHMSAMKMIHDIQQQGGEIQSFKSYCGGLIAPAYDTNPWHYKFTWNPRNVVLAGKSTARYKENGGLKFIPHTRIFTQTENVKVHSGESFDAYANRDSLEYIHPYGIESVHTVLRGTLRGKGFCAAWNALVQLGLNDDSFSIEFPEGMNFRSWLDAFVQDMPDKSLEERVAWQLQTDQQGEIMQKLTWLGLFDPKPLGIHEGSPAAVLEHLLLDKWPLQTGDLDRIIMHHEIGYSLNGVTKVLKSSLEVIGEDEMYTAMSKTVGLPLGIAAKLLLTGKIKSSGVHIPVIPEFYQPILEELETLGISFIES
ncbi:MAG: saccharopine dehydrogenase C-terminal domain-containing protein [Bacteroidia bacterium]|jgi:saccharopine dehydrogenase-like NADP-dependent oxidoreductase